MSASVNVSTSSYSGVSDAASLVTGAAFGAALAACGIYNPGLIVSQLQLEDSTMLRIFLTASLSGGAAIVLLKSVGFFSPKPRAAATKGWFGQYDGNIVGGMMQGVGMALTGSCASTGLVQAVTGVSTSLPTIGGCLLGGLAYKLVGKHLLRPTRQNNGQRPAASNDDPATLATALNIPHWLAVLLFMGAGGAIVYSLPSSTFRTGFISPIRGGLFLGATQALSILLRGKTIGVSTCFEDIWNVASFSSETRKDHAVNFVLSDSVIFAIGVAGGAFAMSQAVPLPVIMAGVDVASIPASRSIAGGAILLFGARLAGGCTSGHGLSGTPTLGIASFLTTACMFLGGIPVAIMLA